MNKVVLISLLSMVSLFAQANSVQQSQPKVNYILEVSGIPVEVSATSQKLADELSKKRMSFTSERRFNTGKYKKAYAECLALLDTGIRAHKLHCVGRNFNANNAASEAKELVLPELSVSAIHEAVEEYAKGIGLHEK